MKKILILPVLVVAVWTAIALYWQIRIGRSMRTFETTKLFSHQTCSFDTSPYERASYELLDAGVRALPALVRSLTPEKSADYHGEASALIWRIVRRTGSGSEVDIGPWVIGIAEGRSERDRKCRVIREWWVSNGHRLHRWWCPWERGYPLE
jgi:hypothetical protein